MARQRGMLGITGALWGVIFDKNGVIRRTPPPRKLQFDTAPSMARVRENAVEFGRAATAGKLLRQALRRPTPGPASRTMISRLTRLLRAAITLDTTHSRGQRQVRKAHAAQLLGFDFNPAAPLVTVLSAPFTVALAPAGVVTLSFPRLVPGPDLTVPAGATHFALELRVALLDFLANTARVVATASVPAATAPTSPPPPAPVLAVALAAPPTATETVVATLGVSFFQELNGQLYPLLDGAANPLTIVLAE